MLTRFAQGLGVRIDANYDGTAPHYFPWYVWVTGAVFAALTAVCTSTASQPDDLAAWWIGGRIVNQGLWDSLYAVDHIDFGFATGPVWMQEAQLIADVTPYPHPFVHAPIIAVLIAPLTTMMSYAAFVQWGAVISGFSFVFLAASSISLWTRKAASPAILAATSAILWLSVAGQNGIWLGQTSPFIYAAIATSLALSANRPIVAGILMSIAAIIKITPIALILSMLIFASRRKAGLVGLGGTLLLLAASWFFTSSSVMSQWLSTISWMNDVSLVAPINASFNSLLTSDPNPATLVDVVTESNPVAVMWKIIVGVVFMILLILLISSRSAFIFEIGATVVLILSTALGGVVWTHYCIVAVIPVVGALLLHSSWLSAFALVLAFPPFGTIYISDETTPLSQPWAPLPLLLVPTALLVLLEFKANPPRLRSIVPGAFTILMRDAPSASTPRASKEQSQSAMAPQRDLTVVSPKPSRVELPLTEFDLKRKGKHRR